MKLKCEYYRENYGESCPFAFSCTEECLFVFKRESEIYREIEIEYKILRDSCWDKDREISELEGEIDDLQIELSLMEEKACNLLALCKSLLNSLKTIKTEEELEKLIAQHDCDSSIKEELLTLIVEE